MTQLNKLQLKAEIMTVLSRLQMDVDTPYIDEYLSNLYEQEDKTDILDILTKELQHSNEPKAILICLVLLKLFDQEILEDVFWNLLKNPSLTDEVKTVILSVLKDLGKLINLEEIQTYFNNPQNVIDSETIRLLNNAIINPESQIDFIDFLNSISMEDKETLIHSLAEDYSSDELANLINPIVLYSPESEIGQECIDILGETKSQLALYTLEEVLSFVKNEDVQNLIKRNISKLKISGIREENAEEFYKKVLPSKPYEAYASYPDGHGNQAVIFSREKEDNRLQMVAIVINDTTGIVDCFGFNNISKLEFSSVIDKFYGNDERIYMDEHAIKRLLLMAEALNHKNDEKISYEYICWKNLFADVSCEVLPLEIILKTNLESKKVSEIDYQKFCMMNFVQKWFFEPQEDSVFEKMISDLDIQVKNNDFSMDLEAIVNKYKDKIFNTDKKVLLEKRLLMSAYLKYLSGSKNDASIIFGIYEDSLRKDDLMKNILRKSIYEHYVSLKYKIDDEEKTLNIFAKRNNVHTEEISKKLLDKMIKKIEDLWVI